MEFSSGAPGRIRTSDPQIRSLVLYPAELRARLSVPKGGGELPTARHSYRLHSNLARLDLAPFRSLMPAFFDPVCPSGSLPSNRPWQQRRTKVRQTQVRQGASRLYPLLRALISSFEIVV
jgi:hypothetical protein